MSKYYQYYPSYFENSFQLLSKEVADKCTSFKIRMYNKDYTPKRRSCVFSDFEAYPSLKTFKWSDSEIISNIREILEEEFSLKFEYCLAHYYPNGEANIGWHNDKEALDTDVVSVSFGATRKFRIKRINEEYEEFLLKGGDVFHMKKGCQRKYKHTIPVEKKVKDARINLTFRQ